METEDIKKEVAEVSTDAPVAAKGRGRRFGNREKREFTKEKEGFEKTVRINRCSKTVKGGRRMSFSAIVISGDQKGKVGFGFGKANDVSEAVKKATEKSKEQMLNVPLKNGTIPHEVIGEYKSAKVVIKPAAPGTGVIAGASVRAVCEACGVTDILSKSLGSKNAINSVKAAMNGLSKLMSADAVAHTRGKSKKEIWG